MNFFKTKKTGWLHLFIKITFIGISFCKSTNVWIACSDANKKNGGLCYLKGSHKLGTIKHENSFAKAFPKIPKEVISKLNFKRIYPNLKLATV